MSQNRTDLQLVLRAAAFAARKHTEQRRKDVSASPYINHPIALAKILAEEGGVADSRVIAAALLHDTIEDTQTTMRELRGEFGEMIAGIVAEVTDTKWLSSTTRKKLQVAKARRASKGAKLVKLADKIANVRDMLASPPAGWSLERRRDYFDWAKSVVDELRGTHARLERKFDQLFEQRP